MSIRHEYPLDSCNNSCDQLKTPVYMLGLGSALLRQYFGMEDRIALEKSKYLWTEDQETSQIYIGYQSNLDYQVIGKRPAIIVSIGDIEYPRDVIGDHMDEVLETGGTHILDHFKGSWLFTCLSDKPLDALGLAGEIKYFFQTYRRYMAPAYSLEKIRVMSIGQYKAQKEFKDTFGCAVNVMFEVQDNFEVTQESLKVGAIQLRLIES